MRKVVCLLMLALLGTGCTMFVRDPVVSVRELKVVSLDGAGAGMELYLTVQNPNPYGVKLLGYSYDLKVMTLPLATGTAAEEVSFPAGRSTELRSPVRVGFAALLELFQRRPDPERIPYALLARLDLETPLGRMKIPVNRTGTYAVPKKYRPGSLLNRLGDFFNQNR